MITFSEKVGGTVGVASMCWRLYCAACAYVPVEDMFPGCKNKYQYIIRK